MSELDGAGPALFQVVRFWSRRWALRASAETTGEERHVHNILVLEAVDTVARRGVQVSVGDVAHELGIDHSGASRFVTAAITDGYLSRGPSSGDRRRVALAVSRSGHELLADAREWQERAFRRLTEGWSAEEAAQFAGYLRRLASELAAER